MVGGVFGWVLENYVWFSCCGFHTLEYVYNSILGSNIFIWFHVLFV